MLNKNEFSLAELEKEEFREYKAFKTFFGQYSSFNKINFSKLDKIRELRTEPARKIFKNDINYLYCHEQDETLKSIYRVIYSIIKAEDFNYELLEEYQNGEYKCFFGRKGGISEYNGLTLKIIIIIMGL